MLDFLQSNMIYVLLLEQLHKLSLRTVILGSNGESRVCNT